MTVAVKSYTVGPTGRGDGDPSVALSIRLWQGPGLADSVVLDVGELLS